MDYKKAYCILFNGITDALMELNKIGRYVTEIEATRVMLQNIQKKTEDMYIEAP
ncbi:hypothetical protein U6B65_08940 [Oscillospiraceae bacterium MB08-C2-2]|nr:hypothetical protein U6B65_08940 [Oscillospiraceae bacterium MB08-C2-2]